MYQLLETPQGLALCNQDNPNELPVSVDFTDKSLLYRAEKLLLSKDGLVKSIHRPQSKFRIFDATAGLGQDSFLLAWLGHDVTLCERSLPVASLLKDGLKRASMDINLAPVIARMHLIHEDSITFLNSTSQEFDIIYCDPMFPESKKSRAVRKSMRALSHMVGMDLDANELLEVALKKAKKKVVLKRPRLSETIGPNPNHFYEYQACRFDVYLP
jgi:16S rRNA (guanine1516-N2)-methyltransferase